MAFQAQLALGSGMLISKGIEAGGSSSLTATMVDRGYDDAYPAPTVAHLPMCGQRWGANATAALGVSR